MGLTPNGRRTHPRDPAAHHRYAKPSECARGRVGPGALALAISSSSRSDALMRGGVAVVALVAACGSGPERDATLTVSVAASLKDVVGALADEFRALHPRVQMAINSGSSGMLAQQIEQGAPVDVFVSAGRLEIDRLV